MKKLFEGSTVIAEYMPDRQLVIYTLDGYVDIEEHKKMYLEIIEFMKTNKVVAFMHDLRNMKGTFTQINDWLVETFRPAIELGLKYSAMVLNDDIFTAFAANDIAGKVKIIKLQIFRSEADAEVWLDEHMKPSSTKVHNNDMNKP